MHWSRLHNGRLATWNTGLAEGVIRSIPVSPVSYTGKDSESAVDRSGKSVSLEAL